MGVRIGIDVASRLAKITERLASDPAVKFFTEGRNAAIAREFGKQFGLVEPGDERKANS